MAFTRTGTGTLEIRSEEDGRVVFELNFYPPAEHPLTAFQRCVLFRSIESMEKIVAVRWPSLDRFEIELFLGEPIRNPSGLLRSFWNKMLKAYQVVGQKYRSVQQIFDLLKELEDEGVLPFEIEW